MGYPGWFDYKVDGFIVGYEKASEGINEVLVKLDIDARDVISIHPVEQTPYIKIWYRKKVEHSQ